MIKFYQEGNSMVIQTDAKDEREFSDQFAEAVARMIDGNLYAGEWYFRLAEWLPQYFELMCAYRGYKTTVARTILYIAGDRLLAESSVRFAFNPELDRKRAA